MVSNVDILKYDDVFDRGSSPIFSMDDEQHYRPPNEPLLEVGTRNFIYTNRLQLYRAPLEPLK